jgi:hypothetical protein
MVGHADNGAYGCVLGKRAFEHNPAALSSVPGLGIFAKYTHLIAKGLAAQNGKGVHCLLAVYMLVQKALFK